MGNNSGERKGINDLRAFIVHFRTYVDFVMLIHVYPGVEPAEGLERGLKHPLLPRPTPPLPTHLGGRASRVVYFVLDAIKTKMNLK